VWITFLSKDAAGLLVLMPMVDADKLRSVFESFDVLKAQATQVGCECHFSELWYSVVCRQFGESNVHGFDRLCGL
jgi:hypothetical protein